MTLLKLSIYSLSKYLSVSWTSWNVSSSMGLLLVTNIVFGLGVMSGMDGMDGISGLDGMDGISALDGMFGLDGMDGMYGFGLLQVVLIPPRLQALETVR